MTETPLSRQRRKQIANRALGLCEQCSRPSPEKAHCDRCAKKDGTKKRNPTKSQWIAVDWSMSNSQIANLLGIKEQRVSIARHAFGIGRNEAIDAMRAEFAKLKRGEFICQKCGLRKNDDHAKGDF